MAFWDRLPESAKTAWVAYARKVSMFAGLQRRGFACSHSVHVAMKTKPSLVVIGRGSVEVLLAERKARVRLSKVERKALRTAYEWTWSMAAGRAVAHPRTAQALERKGLVRRYGVYGIAITDAGITEVKRLVERGGGVR